MQIPTDVRVEKRTPLSSTSSKTTASPPRHPIHIMQMAHRWVTSYPFLCQSMSVHECPLYAFLCLCRLHTHNWVYVYVCVRARACLCIESIKTDGGLIAFFTNDIEPYLQCSHLVLHFRSWCSIEKSTWDSSSIAAVITRRHQNMTDS